MNKKGYFYFFILGIIVGGIVGIIAINTLLSYRIDSYIREIQDLQLTIESKEEQVEKLNEALSTRKYIVKDIEIFVKFSENNNDEILKIDLEKSIKDSISVIIGKEVKTIDMEMLWKVVDGRIIKVNEVNYKIKVKKLLVSENVMIWVEATRDKGSV